MSGEGLTTARPQKPRLGLAIFRFFPTVKNTILRRMLSILILSSSCLLKIIFGPRSYSYPSQARAKPVTVVALSQFYVSYWRIYLKSKAVFVFSLTYRGCCIFLFSSVNKNSAILLGFVRRAYIFICWLQLLPGGWGARSSSRTYYATTNYLSLSLYYFNAPIYVL